MIDNNIAWEILFSKGVIERSNLFSIACFFDTARWKHIVFSSFPCDCIINYRLNKASLPLNCVSETLKVYHVSVRIWITLWCDWIGRWNDMGIRWFDQTDWSENFISVDQIRSEDSKNLGDSCIKLTLHTALHTSIVYQTCETSLVAHLIP